MGAGVNLSQLNYESTLVGYELPSLQIPVFYGPAVYTTPRFSSSQTGDDWGVGFTGGVMVVPNDKIQFGASYRRGARFDFEGEFAYPDPQFIDLSGPFSGEFKVPDNIGAGLAVRPFDGLTVALDVNRVTYSDLTEFLQAQVRFNPEEKGSTRSRTRPRSTSGRNMCSRTGASFRRCVAGSGASRITRSFTPVRTSCIRRPPGSRSDFKHYAIGGGVAPSQRFEFNAGFDFSDRANTMSFSAIVRF